MVLVLDGFSSSSLGVVAGISPSLIKSLLYRKPVLGELSTEML